jgi:hypothetical protein
MWLQPFCKKRRGNKETEQRNIMDQENKNIGLKSINHQI